MRYLILLLVLPLFFISGCKTDQQKKSKDETIIFANYEVRYLEQEKELRGLASFKKGDSIQNAVNTQFQEVTFQGKAMELQNLDERGSRYFHVQKGAYIDNIEFQFREQAVQNGSYVCSMAPVGNFSIKENKVQKSKGITLAWNGPSLGQNESLVCMFTDKNQKAASTFVKGPTKASEAFIRAKDLSGLTLGEGKLYLVKKQVIREKTARLSNLSVVEYYTKTIHIEVIE